MYVIFKTSDTSMKSFKATECLWNKSRIIVSSFILLSVSYSFAFVINNRNNMPEQAVAAFVFQGECQNRTKPKTFIDEGKNPFSLAVALKWS